MLKLNNYSDLSFVKEFKAFIMGKAKNKLQVEEFNRLNDILEKEQCGLLINERTMNLPLALIPPLLNILSSDIQDYKEDNPYDKKFDVDYMIVFSK